MKVRIIPWVIVLSAVLATFFQSVQTVAAQTYNYSGWVNGYSVTMEYSVGEEPIHYFGGWCTSDMPIDDYPWMVEYCARPTNQLTIACLLYTDGFDEARETMQQPQNYYTDWLIEYPDGRFFHNRYYYAFVECNADVNLEPITELINLSNNETTHPDECESPIEDMSQFERGEGGLYKVTILGEEFLVQEHKVESFHYAKLFAFDHNPPNGEYAQVFCGKVGSYNFLTKRLELRDIIDENFAWPDQ